MSRPVELHTPEAHDVIACELTACILGQRRHRDRLELRVDVAGIVLRGLQSLARAVDDFCRKLAERPDYAAALAKVAEQRRAER